MSPDAIDQLGFWFAVEPIAVGTITLVLIAMVYARLTGRHYPLRQFDNPNSHGTRDPEALERLGLTEEELTDLLARYRQSFNLGPEDLARLIGAAELQAAAHGSGTLTAADIMSRDLVTVAPDTPLSVIANLFRRHRFTSLPVVRPDGSYLGLIFQINLISRAREDALRLNRGFAAALKRLLDRNRGGTVRAEDIMSVAGPRATTNTPLAALLPMMADGEAEAVPVLHLGKVTGIVTRTDLIAALARAAVRAP